MIDAFDAMLNKTADVLERGHAGSDLYGVASPAFTTVSVAPVKCRVSLGKGRAREEKSEKKVAKNYRCVFMRPATGLTGTYSNLNHDHWLLIDGEYYDIFQIDNPSELGHHLEVWCELVIP